MKQKVKILVENASVLLPESFLLTEPIYHGLVEILLEEYNVSTTTTASKLIGNFPAKIFHYFYDKLFYIIFDIFFW